MISAAAIQKPKALRQGSRFAVIAPASPGKSDRVVAGQKELERLGFSVTLQQNLQAEGYFAGSATDRHSEFLNALADSASDALIAARGGYDEAFFRNALTRTLGSWTIPLQGDVLGSGSAEGIVLGGAMTLLEATLGTPWEIDTDGAILILEDRAMKPYQIDRVLMHLKHAGKLCKIHGLILGDFPDCEPPVAGSPSVHDVCARILSPLGIPIVYGAPIGHTARSILTIPLGVRARLSAEGGGTLEILEPAGIE